MGSVIGIIVAGVVLLAIILYFKKGGGGGRKKCGYCRAWVRYSATHCPKCGYEFIDF